MDTCVETTCRKDKDGYGKIWDKINKKHKIHHRLVYEQHYGAIPKGQVIRHRCDNPSCINIDHLEIGTHQDNMDDRNSRNRQAKGVKLGRHKFTEDDVRYIRNMKGKCSAYSLAKHYSVDPVTIHKIQKGITWRHIQ